MLKRVTLVSASTLFLVTSCFFGGAKSPGADGCPTSAEEIARIDWGLGDDVEEQVRGGLMAARHIEVLAVEAEGELREPCEEVAKQFFASKELLDGEGIEPEAEVAHLCRLAVDLYDKLNGLAGGTVNVSTRPAGCLYEMEAPNACLDACNPENRPTVECFGEKSGTCEGSCSGQCAIEEEDNCNGVCSGTCYGSCDSEFEGECRGECQGTCDGKADVKECEGECVGSCMEGARGYCGGMCSGNCDEGTCAIEAMGQCDGVCAGDCDQDLKKPRCEGDVSLADSGSECQAACQSVLLAEAQCSGARVKVQVEGAKNEEAAELLRTTLLEYGPQILQARAVALDSEVLAAALTKTKTALTAMNEALAGSDVELAEDQKACAQSATKKAEQSLLVLGFASEAAAAAQTLLE